jgi:hypothetical protein
MSFLSPLMDIERGHCISNLATAFLWAGLH